jgi:dipeptidyl-peptidase-4
MHRLVAFLLALPLLVSAAKKPITIDTVMESADRAEHPSPPIWSPNGKEFVFQKSEKLWLYDVGSRKAAELLDLGELDKTAVKPPDDDAFDWQNRRVSESSAAWSKTGQDLLIASAGDLFLFHKSTRRWDQLTATSVPERDPKLSPDGARVAFRRGHDLYCLEIASKTVTRLTQDGSPSLLNGELDWVYPEELNLNTAFWWSPDSRRIAFLQFDVSHEFVYPQVDLTHLRGLGEPERYPQAGTDNADVRVGIVSATGGRTLWLDLGETRGNLLARLNWTPDSSAVVVHRLNRVQNHLDLVRADAQSGQTATLLSETDKNWINLGDFRFLEDGRFLLTSERDGFRHLYLYSSDGKDVRRLTEGQWEVSSVAGVDEKRKLVYFVASEASPLERQLYVSSLTGGGFTRITQQSGTHAISMSDTVEGQGYFLDTFSSLKNPSSQTLRSIDGREVAVFKEADRKLLEDYELLPTEITSFSTADGVKLYARLIKPAGFDPARKYPAIVMVYGGPSAQSVRDAWSGANWDQVLAARGFVIWQVDNRGSAGRGHAFETPLYRRLGKTELADQLEGVRHLVSLGFVDASRIGLFGWSYGGYMTLYSLLNAPDTFRAGIAGAPVTNWRNYDTIYTERYLGLVSENLDGYEKSSAVEYAGSLKAKLLIIHNFEDDNVLFQNTLQMAARLEQENKLFDMVIYPQKSHGVRGTLRRSLLEKTTDFFEKNLK